MKRRQGVLTIKYTKLGNDPLKKWIKFADPREFRDALTLYSAQHGYDYKLLKNEWARVRTECLNKCGWICHASWDRDKKYFHIKTWGKAQVFTSIQKYTYILGLDTIIWSIPG